jgi:hypothetical protein
MVKILAVLLIVAGLAGLLYGGFTWTDRDTVVDAGPLEITTEDRERLPIPPIAGGLLFVAGIALLLIRPART